jgi:hypothetical protein
MSDLGLSAEITILMESKIDMKTIQGSRAGEAISRRIGNWLAMIWSSRLL